MSDTKPWHDYECPPRTGWSHVGDQIWVCPACGKQSKACFENWTGMNEPERYFSLPPRGISKSRARIGPDIIEHYTFFCPDNDECFAVAYGKTEEGVRAQLKNHVCPAPARRDAHPSGRSVVQKSWDELDDVIDAIKSGNEYLGMSGDLLKGYAQGIAEILAFLAIPYFRFAEDILRQANRRWRIRQGEIPWEATPGYNFFPAQPLEYYKPRVVSEGGKTVKRTPIAKKATPTPVTQVKSFSADEAAMIRALIHEQGADPVTVAEMYGVPVDRILTVAGPPPATDAPVFALDGLFNV